MPLQRPPALNDTAIPDVSWCSYVRTAGPVEPTASSGVLFWIVLDLGPPVAKQLDTRLPPCASLGLALYVGVTCSKLLLRVTPLVHWAPVVRLFTPVMVQTWQCLQGTPHANLVCRAARLAGPFLCLGPETPTRLCAWQLSFVSELLLPHYVTKTLLTLVTRLFPRSWAPLRERPERVRKAMVNDMWSLFPLTGLVLVLKLLCT